MTKALFFDIDGTLVSFETHRIPSSTIEALEAAHAKGLKIFIAYRYRTPESHYQQPFRIAGPEPYRWIYNHERSLLFCR